MKTLARWITALSPSCKEASRLQSDALDRELPLPQRIGLRLHLLICVRCRRYGNQISFLRTAGHKCAEEDQPTPPQPLSAEARARIKSRLQSGGN